MPPILEFANADSAGVVWFCGSVFGDLGGKGIFDVLLRKIGESEGAVEGMGA